MGPDPGCLTEGRTEAEALRNVQDATRLYLEDVEEEAKDKKSTFALWSGSYGL